MYSKKIWTTKEKLVWIAKTKKFLVSTNFNLSLSIVLLSPLTANAQQEQNSHSTFSHVSSRSLVTPKLVGGNIFGFVKKENQDVYVKYDDILDGVFAIKNVSPRKIYSHRANLHCTATMVGPSTLMTAAHCVEPYPDTINPEIIKLNHDPKSNFSWIDLYECITHPDYIKYPAHPETLDGNRKARSSHDIALCFPISGIRTVDIINTNRKAEVIDYVNSSVQEDALKPFPGMQVMMTGTGCQNERIRHIFGTAGSFQNSTYVPPKKQWFGEVYHDKTQEKNSNSTGMLKAGFDTLDRVLTFHEERDKKFDKSAYLQIISKFRADDTQLSPVKLCGGDSGGPLFSLKNKNDVNSRRVIGVNSTGDYPISESKKNTVAINNFVDLNDSSMDRFYTLFKKKHNGALICGLDLHSDTQSLPNTFCQK